MNEFFDPKSLSDEELFERVRKISMLMSYEIQMGHNNMVNSMDMTMAILMEELEYRERKKAKLKEEEMRKIKSEERKISMEFGKIEGEKE